METLRQARRHFYLVVYTEIDADTQKYYCGGGLDLGLTEAGLAEARRLAPRFKKNPLKIKRIIASPELRAVQMADVLHDEIKTKMAVAREFADQFLGDFEGQAFNPTASLGEPPRGESAAAFSKRVLEGLVRVVSEPIVVLLVTHPRVASAIFQAIGLGKEKIPRGVMLAIDIPEGEGSAHFREI